MMDTLFQTDKKVSFKIMDNLETVWKIQATPVAFAYEFQMYDVIAHPSTVALMNEKWYGGMVPSWKQFIIKAVVNDCLFSPYKAKIYMFIVNSKTKTVVLGQMLSH